MQKNAFKDLKNRTWVSCILGLIALVLIYFANQPIVQFILALALTGVIGMCVMEWMSLMHKKRWVVHKRLMFGFTFVWMLSTYLSILQYGMTSFNILILSLFVFFLFVSSFRTVTNSTISIAIHIFGIIYIVLPLSLVLYIVYPSSMGLPDNGRMWLAYLLVLTFITDIGGYFVGKAWGKNKLAPHLSPKKTMEGSLGGLLFCLIASIGFYFVSWLVPAAHFTLTLWQAIVLGLLMGIVGQIGDLAESLIKRDAHTKDSNSIPGIGGLLDMFDSLIFNAPLLFLFLKIV